MSSYLGTDQTDEGKRHFYELVNTFSDAMLVTKNKEGLLRSRPMRILKATPSDGIWFITPVDAGKVLEIEEVDNKINVSLQMANRYLSISGLAKIDRSRRRIEELWNDYLKLWFPHGKESGDIAFVHVVPLQGEYWDSTGILNTLSFVFESAKARLLDKPVEETNIGERGKVDLKPKSQREQHALQPLAPGEDIPMKTH